MKKSRIPGGAAAIALLLQLAPAMAATPLETAAAFQAALKAGNGETVKAMLKPGVQIYESGYVERSGDEYARHHLAGDIAFARTTEAKVLREHEQVDGNLAVVMRETETTGRFQGKPVHVLGTETMVMEKQGDAWLLAHIHWSSRKAAR